MKTVTVTETCNPYKILKENLGKETEEQSYRVGLGVSSIRKWKCGCILQRYASVNELIDTFSLCEKHKHLLSKLESGC